MSETYYLVINEWLYPTESGRDFVDDYDTHEAAMSRCREECERERANYEEVSNCKARLDQCEKANFNGCLMTTSDKCVEWHFLSRVIAVSAMSTDTIRCLET